MTGLPGSVRVWAMVAATIEAASGVALVLGFRTGDFALLLVLINLCRGDRPSLLVRTGDDITRWAQFIPLWKDIGLAGVALFVLARGAGPLSVDQG
jgi:uncharacterized membrane protein YphA (DoxX/SURF4 family)